MFSVAKYIWGIFCASGFMVLGALLVNKDYVACFPVGLVTALVFFAIVYAMDDCNCDD